MKAFFMLPETKSELEKMDFEQKALLWARYSPYPYRRQTRALWHYIQCERAHTTIAAKHITMLRKYMNTVFDKTKNGVLTVTDNNHLILKAFATA